MDNEIPKEADKVDHSPRRRCFFISCFVVVILVCVGIAGFLGYWFTRNPDPFMEEYSPVENPHSLGGPYAQAAVASDAGPCSEVGKNILAQNGSAVDSAIAAMLCIGVVNMHSTGIGGGGFMLVYNQSGRFAEVFDFRETAPAKATEDMFVNATYKQLNSTLSTGIPGEVRGYIVAWKAYGQLPWKQLVQPAIDKAKFGFIINKALYSVMKRQEGRLWKDPGLREVLFDDEGTLKKQGDKITNPQYAKSLEKIQGDPDSFYTGPMAEDIVRDVKSRGGIITLRDLNDYKVVRKMALVNRLENTTWYTVPPPSSGAVIALILNILKGYNMTSEARANTANSSLSYHRIVEAFKFGFAWRSRLGDPAFNNDTKEIVFKIINETFAESLRKKIWDNQTHSNASYYGNFRSTEDHGTSHLSVLSPNGDAVALTSTINYYFGCKYRSKVTGIIYNNEMADFSTPGQFNPDGIEPSKSNFIEAGKRPQSSMSPVIFTDKNGRVKLVAGASGGPLIITAVSLAVMNELWFSRGISKAVDDPRVHHQLLPGTVFIEEQPYTISEGIQKGLKSRRHNITVTTDFSAVQAIVQEKEKQIFGKCDPRKHGWPAGF